VVPELLLLHKSRKEWKNIYFLAYSNDTVNIADEAHTASNDRVTET
jgi:hypothetical protein